jgi:hypothetical protein
MIVVYLLLFLSAIDGLMCPEQVRKLKIIHSHMDNLELCKANLESAWICPCSQCLSASAHGPVWSRRITRAPARRKRPESPAPGHTSSHFWSSVRLLSACRTSTLKSNHAILRSKNAAGTRKRLLLSAGCC